MAKRKKRSKVQKRGKLPRGSSAKRGKARKVAKTAKRAVAKAKPKRTPTVQKEAVAPAVETVVDTTEIRDEESEPKPPSWIDR